MLLWLNSDGGYRYKYISQNTAFVGYDRSEKCSECGREIVKLQYSGAEARYEVGRVDLPRLHTILRRRGATVYHLGEGAQALCGEQCVGI